MVIFKIEVHPAKRPICSAYQSLGRFSDRVEFAWSGSLASRCQREDCLLLILRVF